MRGFNYFLLIISGFLITLTASAKKLPVFSASKNMDSLQVDSILTVCNDLLTLGTPPTDTLWKGNYAIFSATGRVMLGIKKNNTNCLPDTFSFFTKLRIKYWTQKTTYHVFDTTLRVNYNKNKGFSYDEKAIYKIDSACYIETKILSISNSTYRKYLYLENQIEEERYYLSFNPALSPAFTLSYSSTTDEIEININNSLVYQTDEYDVEWTFVSSYTDGGVNNTLSPTNAFYSFPRNAARVTLTGLKYKIANIFDKGYLLFRVRSVAYGGNNFTHRIVGNWSVADTGRLNGLSSAYTEINYSSTVKVHQATLGWQYNVDFAEEARKKELISYFDGSMRNRQTVTRSNTDTTAIVAETIYDFEGRPAVNVLPAPAFQNIIKYFPAFNINSNGDRYSYIDFEQNNICAATTDSMKTTSGASKYYATNNPKTTTNGSGVSKPNPMDYVPVAFGFPFSQTVYLNDNTGRVKKQGGVGIDHQIGSGHETEYLYATPMQDELDRLFGNEVGYYEHYKKNMAIDPNGQVSVSYLNASGNVIATALSATSPGNVEALASNTGRNGVKANLISPSDTLVKDDAITVKREFLVEENGKEYKIYYSLSPQKYFPACNNPANICYDCVYDLEISLIENYCGNQIIKGGGDTIKVLKRAISNGSLDTLCSGTSYTYSFAGDTRLNMGSDTFMVMNLQRGSYTLIKKLTVNKEAYEFYLNDYLTNRTCKSKETFEQEALANLDTSGCDFTCATCFDKLGTQNNYVTQHALDKIGAGYTLTTADTTQFILQYNANKAACEQLCANENPSPCNKYKEVIKADMSPGGQYAQYKFDENLGEYIADDDWSVNYLLAAGTGNPISYKTDTYFNGDSVLINGVKTAYKDLSVADFIQHWKPEFADHLMPYHPEYCKYQWCTNNENSFRFDKDFLSTQTYQEASDSGYLSPLASGPFDAKDPFFQTGASGVPAWYNLNYKVETNFISNNTTISYSIKEIPVNIIFCDHLGSNETARRACVTQYMDSIQNCEIYKDGYWKYFRSLYYSAKQQTADSLRKLTGCISTLVPGGYAERFPDATTDQASNISTMRSDANQQMADSCASNCHAYREAWKEQLRHCAIDSTQMERVLDSLEQVCRLGCDFKSPYGSSTVAPQYQTDTTVKLKSFHDVLTGLFAPTNIYVPGICDATSIQFPKKYGHDLFVTLSPFADTCACNQINNIDECTDTTGMSNIKCPCTNATANKPGNQLLKMMNGTEDKFKCNTCINCDRFRAIYQAYYNIYDTFNLNTLQAQKIFTQFMNDSLGFNLSFKEFTDFAAACIDTTYNNVLADTLYSLYRSHFIIYKGNIRLGYQNSRPNNFPYNTLIEPSKVLIAKESANPYQQAIRLKLHNNTLLSLNYINEYITQNNTPQNTLTASLSGQKEQVSNTPFKTWVNGLIQNKVFNLMAPPPPPPPSGVPANLDSCGCDKILLAIKEYEAKKTTDYAYLKNASEYFAGAYNNYHPVGSFDTLAKICCYAVNGLTGPINFNTPEPCEIPSDWAPNQWRRSGSNGNTRATNLALTVQNNFVTEPLPDYMKCNYDCTTPVDACGCDSILTWYEKFKTDSTSGKTFTSYLQDSTGYNLNNLDTIRQICTRAFELSQEPASWDENGNPVFGAYANNSDWNGASRQYIKAIVDALPAATAMTLDLPGPLSCTPCNGTSTPFRSLLSCFDITQRMNSHAGSFQDTALQLFHFADTAGASQPHGLLPLFNDKYDSVVTASGGNYNLAFQVARQMQNDSMAQVIKLAKQYQDSTVKAINDSFSKAPFFNTFSSLDEILEYIDANGCFCSLTEDQINALPPLVRAHLQSQTNSTRFSKNYNCNFNPGNPGNAVVKKCGNCYIPDPILLHIQNYLDTLTHHAETLNNGVRVNKLSKTWWRMYPTYKKYYQTPLYNGSSPSSLKYKINSITAYKLSVQMFDSTGNSKNIELVFAEPFKHGNFLTIRKFFGIRLRSDMACDTQTIQSFSIYGVVQRPGTLSSTGFDTIYMTGKVTGWNTAKPINKCCLKLCNRPVNQINLVGLVDPCKERIKIVAKLNAEYAWQRYTDSLRQAFQYAYYNKCLRLNGKEYLQMRYNERQYHYTLYYYDQSGNLVKTVPPAGVNPLDSTATDSVAYYRAVNSNILKLPAHTLVTHYRYNSLNQVTWQQTPDAGQSEFYYDYLGRLAVSQNAKQKPVNYYSYSLYDNLGRMKEVGEVYKTVAMTQSLAFDTTNLNNWLNTTTKRQITNTYYDEANYALIDTLFFNPENLRSRVTHITYKEFNSTGYNHAVHYSYDIHGNVKKLLREIPMLKTLGQDYKIIDYDYDLISGKVNSVNYQQGAADQYMHQYQYDADLRLTQVQSGPNQTLLDVDAKYYYYLHGPLARTELGYHQVQGMDYAYTIHGWLKGVNASTTNQYLDMGKDGNTALSGNENSNFAKDVFGFTLSYYQGDYFAANTLSQANQFEAKVAASALNASVPNLYNGNIRAMAVSISQFGNTPMAYAYQYDQLNRIISANTWNNYDSTNNIWSTSGAAIPAYHNRFTYDANGNILSQVRRGSSTTLAMDSLSYQYYSNTNKLKRVKDTVNSSNYTDDIDNQLDSNYNYDAIGNLIKDSAEQISSIEWTVYGKIRKITRTGSSTKPDLEFEYTPDGHRVVKIVKPKDGSQSIYTYYVHDAQGNILATYTRTFSKTLDYANLRYDSVNNKINAQVGTSAFATFTATYSNNSGLKDYLLSQLGTQEALLRSFNPYYLLSNHPTALNQTLNGFSDYDYVDIFLKASSDFATLCDCFKNAKEASVISYNLKEALFLSTYGINILLEDLFNNSPGELVALANSYGFEGEEARDALIYLKELVGNMEDPEQRNKFIEDLDHIIDYDNCSNIEKALHDSYNRNHADVVNALAGLAGIRSMFYDSSAAFGCALRLSQSTVISHLSTNFANEVWTSLLTTYSVNDLLTWLRNNDPDFLYKAAYYSINTVSTYQAANNLYGGPYGGLQNYFVNMRTGLGQSTYDIIVAYFLGQSSLYTDSMNVSEWHLYGSSRVGIYQSNINLAYRNIRIVGGVTTDSTSVTTAYPSYALYALQRGNKRYELTNHLGNVLVVLSDKKIQQCSSTVVASYVADVVSANDYSAFHATLSGRSYTASNTNYRFGGSNGQEKDDEIFKGAYTAEYWEYDSRLGRRWNVDNVYKSWQSNYVCFSDNPINKIDPDGNDDYFNAQGDFIKHTNTKTNYIKIVQSKGNELKLSEINLNQAHNRKAVAKIVVYYANILGHGSGIYGVSRKVTKKNTGAFYSPSDNVIYLAAFEGKVNEMYDVSGNLKSALNHEKSHKSTNENYPDHVLTFYDHYRVYFGETVNNEIFKETSIEYKVSTAIGATQRLLNALHQDKDYNSFDIDLKELQQTFNKYGVNIIVDPSRKSFKIYSEELKTYDGTYEKLSNPAN